MSTLADDPLLGGLLLLGLDCCGEALGDARCREAFGVVCVEPVDWRY